MGGCYKIQRLLIEKILDETTSGRYESNPIFNTLTYDVDLPDEEVCEYVTNIITDNMISQVNWEGFTTTDLKSITDFAKNYSAVKISNIYCTTK